MNAEEYKSLCNRPDVFPRGVIESSERELIARDSSLAARLREILDSAPIAKPPLYDGSRHNDYLLVEIDVNEAEEIIGHLLDAEVGAVGLEGETTAEASRVGSLVDIWTQYIEFHNGVASFS